MAAAVAGTVMIAGGPANALLFNADITPDTIYGSGNSNGSFTVDRSGGVEIGLRGKIPYVGTLFSNNYCYFLDGTSGAEIHAVNYGTPLDGLTTIPDVVSDGSWELVAGGRSGLATCISGGTAVAPKASGTPYVKDR